MQMQPSHCFINGKTIKSKQAIHTKLIIISYYAIASGIRNKTIVGAVLAVGEAIGSYPLTVYRVNFSSSLCQYRMHITDLVKLHLKNTIKCGL